MSNNIDQYFDVLESLLSEERKSLLNGDFEEGQQNSQKIAQLITTPPTIDKSLSDEVSNRIEAIRLSAQRNADIYSHAIEGVEMAKRKVQMINDACFKLNTYCEAGNVDNKVQQQKSWEKKV